MQMPPGVEYIFSGVRGKKKLSPASTGLADFGRVQSSSGTKLCLREANTDTRCETGQYQTPQNSNTTISGSPRNSKIPNSKRSRTRCTRYVTTYVTGTKCVKLPTASGTGKEDKSNRILCSSKGTHERDLQAPCCLFPYVCGVLDKGRTLWCPMLSPRPVGGHLRRLCPSLKPYLLSLQRFNTGHADAAQLQLLVQQQQRLWAPPPVVSCVARPCFLTKELG